MLSDQERARALSGATRECPLWETAWHGFGTAANPECQSCHGPGRVPILNPERARKVCPGLYALGWAVIAQGFKPEHGERCCGGDGWLSTLLLPDGRWDEERVRTLLREAGCKVVLTDDRWGVRLKGSGRDMSWSDVLAVAACEALGIGTEVKG